MRRKKLEDNKTCEYYNLNLHSILHLKISDDYDRYKMFIFYKNYNEIDKYFLEVDICDTIEKVKTKIQFKEGILLNDRDSLYYNNLKLDDKKTLLEYNIEKGAILRLTRHTPYLLEQRTQI